MVRNVAAIWQSYLVYYGFQGRLEYDLIVAPGSDPDDIKLRLRGNHGIELDTQGDLLLGVEGGDKMRLSKPVVNQEVDGIRRDVPAGFAPRSAHEVGFRVANYDIGKPLVIDPVLVYSTYLGAGNAQGRGVAVDASGNEDVHIGLVVTNADGTAAEVITPPEINPLRSQHQVAKFLHELLPSKETFIGSVSLVEKDGKRFAVVALVLDHDQLTAIPVIRPAS